MSARWLRLYTELVNDPKVQLLPDRLFKAWINILCIAADNGGVLPPVEAMRFSLRLSGDAVTVTCDELVTIGLLDRTDGALRPHNWNGRQFNYDTKTSAERTRKWRASKSAALANGDASGDGHGDRHGDAPSDASGDGHGDVPQKQKQKQKQKIVKNPRSNDLGQESPPAVPTTEVAIVEPKKEALEARKKSGGKRKTMMREEWKPSQGAQVFALERMGGSFAKVGEFTEEFRQYWIGRGDLQADWNARFRHRVMTQYPQNGGQKNGRYDRKTAAEKFNDGVVYAVQARAAERDDRGENYPISALLAPPEPSPKN